MSHWRCQKQRALLWLISCAAQYSLLEPQNGWGRLKWRAAYRAQLQVYLAKIHAETVEPLIAERSIDDGIRYQSATFALSKATDKIMLLVRCRPKAACIGGLHNQSAAHSKTRTRAGCRMQARTVAADPWIQLRARHRHKWRTWRFWLGKYGYD